LRAAPTKVGIYRSLRRNENAALAGGIFVGAELARHADSVSGCCAFGTASTKVGIYRKPAPERKCRPCRRHFL
jgi:hypothetical protein